jgi:hypothetical protein
MNTQHCNSARLLPAVMLCIATLAWAAVAYGDTNTDFAPHNADQRFNRLEAFFQSYKCPAPHYVDEYLNAADSFAIDYRLLPAISVLESTCGTYQRHNNRWGWDSARKGFSSFRAGLQYIAHQLAEGRFYKNKTLEQKVHAYNPRPQYAHLIRTLMRKIEDHTAVPNTSVAATIESPPDLQ